MQSKLKLVVFDMDGVIVREKSSWQILHRYFNVNPYPNLKSYLDGKISYKEFMELDVKLWIKSANRSIYRSEIEEVLKRSLKFNDGAKEVIDYLKRLNINVALITSGIDIMAYTVAKKLGIRDCLCNELKFDVKGKLVGAGIERVPLLDKDKVVMLYSKSAGYNIRDEVAYIGDSVFDIPVFKVVALPIAYSEDPKVCMHAKIHFTGTLKKLIELLDCYLQHY